MLIILAFSRLFLFFSLTIFYVLALSFTSLLRFLDSHLAKRVGIFFTKKFCKIILLLFNIKVFTDLRNPDKASLFLCNHLSYLDAVALFSELEAIFITSTEIRDSGGLGVLCRLGNCLFTNRESFWEIKKEIKEISATLDQGFNVVLFPEGTTSSGHFMQNFKSSLVQAAVDVDSPVVPLAVNYSKFNDRTPLLEDRDYYAWYGTMDFMPHIIRLATIRSLEIKICQLPSQECQQIKGARKIVTKRSQKMIDDTFEPVIITS